VANPPTIGYKSIAEKWELNSLDTDETYRLISYKPNKFAILRWSNNPNTLPQSENPEYSATEPLELDQFEAKFQISFKTKIIDHLFKGNGDLWIAFTQKGYWQLYNADKSRSFREINFQPELIYNYPINFNLLGFNARTTRITLNHQSNGRDIPYSRSWNRIIFHLEMENKNWQLIVRPWIQFENENRENPEINNYIGRAEFTILYHYKNCEISTIITHPFNKLDRGSIQFDYIVPIKGQLKGFVQFFKGYGESLIDYNHQQNTIGFGLTIMDW